MDARSPGGGPVNDNGSFWNQFGVSSDGGFTPGRIDWNSIMQAWGQNGTPGFSAQGQGGNVTISRTNYPGSFGAGTGPGGSSGSTSGQSGSWAGEQLNGVQPVAGGTGAPSATISQAGGAGNGSWLSNLFGGGSGTGAGMSTADWVRLGAGAVGAYGSYADSQARNEAARANSGPQNYSSQSSNNPYGPSTGYRDIAMQQALALLQGGQGQGGGRGGRGGGGGGNGGYQSDWGGSQALADAMRERAMNGDPNVNANAQYMQNALNDPYGGSQLLGRTFEAADGLNNGAVDQFVQNMMSQWGGGNARPQGYGGGGGVGGGGGGLVSNGHGGMVQGGGGGHKLVGVAGDIRAMLDGSSEANPQLQAMIDQVNRGTTESYQRGLAGLSGQSEASGMYGSSDHQLADAQAALGFTRGLAENETGIRYQDFGRQRDELMQAMGLGTQYDLGMAGIDAQAEAARNSTSASSAAAANSNALQRELGNRGLMLQAMGLQNDMSQFGLGTMQNLSGMDVQNRQFMLGAGLDYGNFDMGQMGTAFGANFGLDQAQNADAARQAQMRNQASQQAWQRQQQAQNQPWNNLARYMDIINGASSGYGTSQESGVRPGTQQPESNNWLAAIQGGLGAAQSANNIYRGWNQGMGSQP